MLVSRLREERIRRLSDNALRASRGVVTLRKAIKYSKDPSFWYPMLASNEERITHAASLIVRLRS